MHAEEYHHNHYCYYDHHHHYHCHYDHLWEGLGCIYEGKVALGEVCHVCVSNK